MREGGISCSNDEIRQQRNNNKEVAKEKFKRMHDVTSRHPRYAPGSGPQPATHTGVSYESVSVCGRWEEYSLCSLAHADNIGSCPEESK